MWFKIRSFLHFLFESTNHHGVHSPFVFSFVTKCLYKKPASSIELKLRKIRNYVLNNHELIRVFDYGKGSQQLKGRHRKVSEIGKIAGSSLKKSVILNSIVDYFESKSVLELGTSIGLGSSALALENTNATITTVEGCKNSAASATSLFQKFTLENIDSIIGKFNDVLPELLKEKHFDLIFFDGHHDKTATQRYFETCLPFVKKNSIFIFDDIYWSIEMQEAWTIIKNHPRVTVSVDIYYFGILFFNEDLSRQHFKIRT